MSILENILQLFIHPKPKKPRKIWSTKKTKSPVSPINKGAVRRTASLGDGGTPGGCKTPGTILVDWHKIPLTIIHSSKAKRFRLSYSPGHEIRVTVPQIMSDTILSMLLKQHESRILKHHLAKSDSIIDSNPNLSNHSREHFLIHKWSAIQFCTHKVEEWNQKLWWNYNTITVKSLKTKRWSCSSKWNLNFNYKLMFLPEPMADYVIVHELCHLREMNHGPKFWKLVEEVYGPEWRKWRKIK